MSTRCAGTGLRPLTRGPSSLLPSGVAAGKEPPPPPGGASTSPSRSTASSHSMSRRSCARRTDSFISSARTRRGRTRHRTRSASAQPAGRGARRHLPSTRRGPPSRRSPSSGRPSSRRAGRASAEHADVPRDSPHHHPARVAPPSKRDVLACSMQLPRARRVLLARRELIVESLDVSPVLGRLPMGSPEPALRAQ